MTFLNSLHKSLPQDRGEAKNKGRAEKRKVDRGRQPAGVEIVVDVVSHLFFSQKVSARR